MNNQQNTDFYLNSNEGRPFPYLNPAHHTVQQQFFFIPAQKWVGFFLPKKTPLLISCFDFHFCQGVLALKLLISGHDPL